MIVLDTNVLSELMRPRPAEPVRRWLSAQPARILYTTTISLAEILVGIRRLPDGKRRFSLSRQAEAMFTVDFAGRILSFDVAAAPAFAALSVQRQQAGRNISPVDGMIAAIAQAHGAIIASRDADFANCGVALINPWELADARG